MTVHARNATATARPLKDARATGALTTAPTPPVRVIGGKGRTMARTLYANHLKTATSKAGDTYSRRTVEGYLEAVDALGEFLTTEGFPGDFTDVDTPTLNAFLAAYRATHTQGGTNTKSRRLRPFFGWLEATFPETVSPFRGEVAFYAASKPAPSALSADVAADLLAAAAGTDYEAIRDRAIIRLLLTGVRRGELHGIHMEDVDWAGGLVRVAALKDAKKRAAVVRIVDGQEQRAGRLVPLNAEAVVALHAWAKVRARHKLVKAADAGPMWYASRGRGRMTGNGILRMIKRRAEQAGYDPGTINVHAFRHTRAHTLLSGGMEEGDVMELMGWRDRTMLDRYGSNLKAARAIDAARRMDLA